MILGVDTHLDTHVGAVIDEIGHLLGTLATPTNVKGYQQLLNWARSYGNLEHAGVEGTGTYGAGLARLLREQGITVWEINRPDRSKRRLQGKSDPTDAEKCRTRSVVWQRECRHRQARRCVIASIEAEIDPPITHYGR